MHDLRVEAFVADAVEAVNGKLYALGLGWNRMIARGSFPLVHHNLGVGVVVHVPYSMTNEHRTIGLGVIDQDGVDVVRPINGNFTIGRPPDLEAGDEQVVALAFNLQGMTFPKPDLYAIVVSVDGVEKCRLPLRVRAAAG
jgi:hypothetical protein